MYSKTSTSMAYLAAALFGATQVYASIENPSILPTPPMGFNDWARFECAMNQSLFVETADAMVSKGLLAAGYNRINLDDCWPANKRLPNGSLTWNTTKFPDGMFWLGDYLHNRGFHFGIYEDAGNATCGGYPGTLGHEALDAKTFESWGVDYLKLDGCNVYPGTVQRYQSIYGNWHKVLTSLKSPLIFSESAPAYFSDTKNNTDWYTVMDWVPLYGELARHSTDIAVYGLYPRAHYWKSVLTNYGFEVLLARYQQPGYYNDPDFIIPDWPWLTLNEKKSQFALWSSFSAPLIMSADVPTLGKAEIEYLTNADIIAIDQDALALQATLVSQDGYFDVLTKSLSNGDRLLTVLNRGSKKNSTTIAVERMGLSSTESYTAKDLWTGRSTSLSKQVTVTLPTHATAIYRISGCKAVTPTGMLFNTATMGCMTAFGSKVTFGTCMATDEQVWMVSSKGTVSPLSAPTTCLAQSGSQLKLATCSSSSKSMQWVYHVTGNLVNSGSGDCLQQNIAAGAVAKCGNEQDDQVFGLPSGVEVIRGNVV